MTTNPEIPNELHIKICKKIAQLTKVIYTLNTKAEEHDSIMDKLNEQHTNRIQNIMLESKNKIAKYKDDIKYVSEKEKELKNIQEMLKQVKEENERLQKSLREHLSNTEMNERQLRNGYENKFLTLQNMFLERKRDYSELLELFDKYKQDILDKKQKEIIELTFKHEEQDKNTKLSHERDLNVIKEKYVQSEKILNEKIQTLQDGVNTESKLHEDEYESKLIKLKQFYEEELKLSESQKNENNKKEWIDEKAKMISELELTKTDLNNRICFLESKLNKRETASEELEKQLQSLQCQLDEKFERISSLDQNIFEKNKEIDILNEEHAIFQSKVESLEQQLHDAFSQNDGYAVIQEAYEDVAKKLDEREEALKELNMNYNQLKDTNTHLTTQNSTMEANNSKLVRRCSNETELKEAETNKCKHLEEELKEKEIESKQLEEKLSEVESQHKKELSKEREHSNMMKKKIEDVKSMFYQANTRLKDKQDADLQKQKEMHTESLKQMKEQAALDLKETEEKLSLKFEDDKNKFCDSQIDDIRRKDELIEELKEKVEGYERNVEELTKKYEESYDENKRLKMDLNINQTILDDNTKELEEKISDLQLALENEKSRGIIKLEETKKQLEDKHSEAIAKLEKKWDKKLRNTNDDNEIVLQNQDRKMDMALNKMKSKHEDERTKLEKTKDEKIELLEEKINELKLSFKSLNEDFDSQKEKHDTDLLDNVSAFEEEKGKMVKLNKAEMEKLRRSMENEMTHVKQRLNVEKSMALENSEREHESFVIEIRNEHLQSVKALRNQCSTEKQDEIGMLRRKLSLEKDELRKLLKVQMDGQINAITKECENLLDGAKSQLHHAETLRQQEFLVHTKKISELASNLEYEKEHAQQLNKKILRMDDTAKQLRYELENKGQEILEIRRESNFKLQCELENLAFKHRDDIKKSKDDHNKEKLKLAREWEDTKSALMDQMSILKIEANEAEQRFMNRESRTEDLEKIYNLTEKVFEGELECKRLRDEGKHYKLELINREENFNKVFSNTPNVGLMDPIQLSKRNKSSKKR